MSEAVTQPGLALAGKGFRPFFLLAGLYAALIVPLWVLIVDGVLAPVRYLDAWSWHAHEMIFGYALAVIAGFLLTAVGNWTGRETLIGRGLLGLALLWVLARAAMATAAVLPRGLPAALDLGFLLALAIALARPILLTHNRRNYVMVGVLGVLLLTNLVTHLSALGVLAAGQARRANLVAIDVIVLLIVVVTGRVMPMFTRNTTKAEGIEAIKSLDWATMTAGALLTLVDAVALETVPAQLLAGLVAVLAAARALRWGTRHVRPYPMLWVLHLGYAWIPLGLLLRAAPALGVPVWGSLATHALTAGAIGVLTLGMMARVGLGHTGRPIVASRAITGSFLAILGAAMVRVFVPLVALRWQPAALVVAGALWSLAFVIFVIVYTPIFFAPRPDGKAG